jgi:hypothetical protein
MIVMLGHTTDVGFELGAPTHREHADGAAREAAPPRPRIVVEG